MNYISEKKITKEKLNDIIKTMENELRIESSQSDFYYERFKEKENKVIALKEAIDGLKGVSDYVDDYFTMLVEQNKGRN